MIVEQRSQDVLVLRPESTAEEVFLKSFAGGKVEIELPNPFQPNITVLKIERLSH